jgi:hypothetical protein
MGITQTIEQHITGRPAIRVPGESIIRFFRRNFGCKGFLHGHRRRSASPTNGKGKEKSHERPEPSSSSEEESEPSNLTEPPSESGGGELTEPSNSFNAAMKWGAYFGQGVMLGGVRGILSYYGVRGLLSDMVFLGFTSSVDRCPFWAEMTENVPL